MSYQALILAAVIAAGGGGEPNEGPHPSRAQEPQQETQGIPQADPQESADPSASPWASTAALALYGTLATAAAGVIVAVLTRKPRAP